MNTKYNIVIIFLLLLQFVSLQTNEAFAQKQLAVVIDAGHGGRDPGNLASSSDFFNEKDINLKIALKVGTLIDSMLQNVTVHYTRTTDVFISLDDRTQLANDLSADYFISIHCNSSTDSTVNGYEAHIHNYKCKESSQFAQKISDDLRIYTKLTNRGVKSYKDRNNSNLKVIKSTKMPAVLIECGFMTNRIEEEYLNSTKGQNAIAWSIFCSFRDFSRAASKPKCKETFKVQIKASVDRISLKSPEFIKVEAKIEEQYTENATFKYKYFVGNFCSIKDANKLRDKLRAQGFKDAFVISQKNKN